MQAEYPFSKTHSVPSRRRSDLTNVPCALLVALTATLPVRAAALWESPDWALFGTVDGEVAYDSNIFSRNPGSDDTSDTVFSAVPELRLSRRAAVTQIDVRANATIRRFVDFSDENSTDPGIFATLSYPNVEEELPKQEVELRWFQQTDPDPDVGQRVERTVISGDWVGQIYDTGKTSFIGRTTLSQTNNNRYDGTSDYGMVGLGVGFNPRSLLRYGATYNYEREKYTTTRPGGSNYSRGQHQLIVGVRGELSPKISGRAQAGIVYNDIKGDFASSKTDWSAYAELTWRPDDRRDVRFNFRRHTYFTVDGRLVVTSQLMLEFRQQISGGFSGTLRGFGRRTTRYDGGADSYDTFGGGASLFYNFTGRLTAEIGVEYSETTSDLDYYDHSRERVFAGMMFAF